MNNFKENHKGNWCKKIDGKWCTVFLSSGEKGWTWVYDGEFCKEVFETAEDAIYDAEYTNGEKNER